MYPANWTARITASTVAASIGDTFAYLYSIIKTNNAHWLGAELPSLTTFYVWASPWGAAVPAAILLAGMGCLRCKTRKDAVLHIVSYAGWLFALVWSLGCILAWEVPYVIIHPKIK